MFVTVVGQGTITSVPRGIACPPRCYSAGFYKTEQVTLLARPTAGWRLVGWSGPWCSGPQPACAFDLTDSHDCAGGMCPVGAFGLHVTFARADGSG